MLPEPKALVYIISYDTNWRPLRMNDPPTFGLMLKTVPLYVKTP
jgi:hypothetical protein